jgi:pimeloyl-ACP methyl ester carboxylesterase
LSELPCRASVCFDFPGYGLSEKPRGRSYSIFAQTDVAEAVADRFVGGPVVVVAHDMGTSVATELLARDLEGRLTMRVAAVLLLNGSVVIERSRPTLGQRLLRTPLGPFVSRLSNRRMFAAQLASVFADRRALGRQGAEDAWSLVTQSDGHRMLHAPLVYMRERTVHAGRWHGAVRDWQGSLAFAWGMRDPVARPAVLDALVGLRPRAPVTRWDEVGHYPQLEAPAKVAACVASLADACRTDGTPDLDGTQTGAPSERE